MNDVRKQELRQLLNEAIENLEIRIDSANRHQLPPIIDVNEYRSILQQYWIFHSINFLSPATRYESHIVNTTTKSKLLDFIREEFTSFIHEDKIQSASFFIVGIGSPGGYTLDSLLDQLLKIAIVHGIGRAVADFDKCTKNTYAPFQYFALLEGIRVEAEIQGFEGVRLVPLPLSTSELSNYLPVMAITQMAAHSFLGKTLLIIDAFMSPIFHKPSLKQLQRDDIPFQIEAIGGKFPKFKADDFYEKFCQAMSLACNSAVQISLKWLFLAEDELFNLNAPGQGGITRSYDADPFGSFTTAGKAQIDEAKRLYELLEKLNSDVRKKLDIVINRWIKSKTYQNFQDKIIDLVIAFEALYLPDAHESTFKFAVRASWHLGKDQEDRTKLFEVFKELYKCRSKVVHGGELKENVIIEGEPVPINKFITRAQDLCRDSIEKIMKQCSTERKFPKNDYWDSLILGEESS
ncbi:MAG: HEPN domain-containing protein [Candidatus Poribacteria bacterium]|nr:HEPN domain-containing protein [Candidatus Poribacteria bacterium]